MSRPGVLTGKSLVVAGVDEAGLGPLLGPLSIGWSVLRLPRPGADPWKLLARSVSKDPRQDDSRLIVADSKRVFTRNPRGRRRLERTVLSFLGLLDGPAPATPGEILFRDLHPDSSLVERHPWYEHLPPRLPANAEPGRIELGCTLLGRDMDRRGCALLDAGVRIVPAGELNDSYTETANKSLSVWAKTLEVLRHLWRRHGADHPFVVLDRQGARSRYGALLARGISDASVLLVRETEALSEYELEGRRSPRRMRIVVVERAEDRSFPVALASCIAKYAREVVMGAFNAYFTGLQPDLRPTAGYRTDGWRWLEEAKPALLRARLQGRVLVRER